MIDYIRNITDRIRAFLVSLDAELDAAEAAYERAIAASREGARARSVRDRVRDLIA